MWAHARFDTRRSTALAAPALVVAGLAEAQPLSPSGSAATDPSAGGVSGMLVFLVVMVALFAIVAVVVKALDRRRKRSEEAVQLQARIADAMLLDPALGKVAITATVTAPFRQHAPVTVEVRGQAPTPALRDAALSLVLREASASGLPFRVEDRTTVSPPAVSRRAA